MNAKFFLFLLVAIVLFSDCRKNNVSDSFGSNIEWFTVYPIDRIYSNLAFVYFSEGKNGKIITDDFDNIYLYITTASNYLNFTDKTSLIKFSKLGKLLWIKNFNNLEPYDLVKMNDGRIVLSGFRPPSPFYNIELFVFKDTVLEDTLVMKTGKEIKNSSMTIMPDNSIILSANTLDSFIYQNCFAKVNSSFKVEWKKFNIPILGAFTFEWEQNSIISCNNHQCIFQYMIGNDVTGIDSVPHGLVTGVINDDGSIDTFYYKNTGYSILKSGKKEGINNAFVRGIISDGNGGFIYHFSNPQIFNNIKPAIPSGFLKINSRGKVTDTIPIDLPDGYQISSCCYNKGRFLLIANSTSNVNAIFMTGGSDFKVTKTYNVNNFYSSFFNSVAATNDGGFIISGKIQSFGGDVNKLVLMKWK